MMRSNIAQILPRYRPDIVQEGEKEKEKEKEVEIEKENEKESFILHMGSVPLMCG